MYHRCRNKRLRAGVLSAAHRCERGGTIEIGGKWYCAPCAVVVENRGRFEKRTSPVEAAVRHFFKENVGDVP